MADTAVDSRPSARSDTRILGTVTSTTSTRSTAGASANGTTMMISSSKVTMAMSDALAEIRNPRRGKHFLMNSGKQAFLETSPADDLTVGADGASAIGVILVP